MTCQEFDDLAPQYALGSLEPALRLAMEEHLATCDRHSRTLAELRHVVEALPLEAPDLAAPPRIKTNLMAAVRAEAPARRRRFGLPSLLRPLPLALGAAVAVVVALLAWNLELHHRPGDHDFTRHLASASGASGDLYYITKRDVGILQVQGLPLLPAGQTYEVWLNTRSGPIKRGFVLANDAAQGVALIDGDISPRGLVYVTVEPAGGSDAPSGPVVLSTSPTP